MAEQDAVLLRTVGKPVELGRRPVPTPTESQVLIKVTSAMRKSSESMELYNVG
jgi:D-arabinose 1-dehydrogenase-like Zn-dependent alcohol dehydrogenase